mmetsp:Transcript_42893/g.118597  ORF Transcript_42893/g.118597 Transcript_42893/m.118597 type:complete len:218 (+) Transcript_42893:662-1315(+)
MRSPHCCGLTQASTRATRGPRSSIPRRQGSVAIWLSPSGAVGGATRLPMVQVVLPSRLWMPPLPWSKRRLPPSPGASRRPRPSARARSITVLMAAPLGHRLLPLPRCRFSTLARTASSRWCMQYRTSASSRAGASASRWRATPPSWRSSAAAWRPASVRGRAGAASSQRCARTWRHAWSGSALHSGPPRWRGSRRTSGRRGMRLVRRRHSLLPRSQR